MASNRGSRSVRPGTARLRAQRPDTPRLAKDAVADYHARVVVPPDAGPRPGPARTPVEASLPPRRNERGCNARRSAHAGAQAKPPPSRSRVSTALANTARATRSTPQL